MSFGIITFPAEPSPIAQVETSILSTINDNGGITVNNEETTVAMIYKKVYQSGYQPNTTIVGNAGSATIHWINSGQIYWRISPDSDDYCTFAGTITIKDISTNKTVKTLWVSGAGTGTISDNEYFSGLTRGKTYLATLSGSGTLGVFPWLVGPNCHETYYVH
ncbi:MAG: hypothetical protein QME46_00885 [Thermoanaerobacteraceae bacterium]|nr:hypothetical protein [Thermoanaerobacteraceae bacterium]